GEIQRVGSDEVHHVNVRVIAATNRDLEQEVANQRFRADLYHRLSVYPIRVPALRERGDDISLLAGHFMQQCERKFGLRGLRLSQEAVRWLKEHPWPGNVRELEHCVSRAVVRALGESPSRDTIIELTTRLLGADTWTSSADLPSPSSFPYNVITLAEAVETHKRELDTNLQRRHGHNLCRPAR